jgi:hypothetical protein
VLFVALADTPPPGASSCFELAEAQFAKYRPAQHRYLGIGDRAFPGAVEWAPLTERIVVRAGDRGRRALLPTFTRPVVGHDAELDDWYTNWHLPEVLGVAGYAAGQRFARPDSGADSTEPTRLALYELDAADLHDALAALQAALPGMRQTTALDHGSIGSWCFVPLETR